MSTHPTHPNPPSHRSLPFTPCCIQRLPLHPPHSRPLHSPPSHTTQNPPAPPSALPPFPPFALPFALANPPYPPFPLADIAVLPLPAVLDPALPPSPPAPPAAIAPIPPAPPAPPTPPAPPLPKLGCGDSTGNAHTADTANISAHSRANNEAPWNLYMSICVDRGRLPGGKVCSRRSTSGQYKANAMQHPLPDSASQWFSARSGGRRNAHDTRPTRVATRVPTALPP